MGKIGLFTVLTANNYGTILQALALQETINKMGFETEFIRIPDSLLEELESKETSKKMMSSKRFLNISEKIYNQEIYDVIIIGSDEIWNIKNNSFQHKKEYFGHGFNCNNIVAYAPSCNVTTLEEFKEYIKNENIDFSKFKQLSVRDENTKKIVEEVSKSEVPILLDPTFLMEDYLKYTKKIEDKDYLLVYGYSFTTEEIIEIKRIAKEKGLPIYSIGMNQDWVDKHIDGDITDFLGYIKNAKYVITSTFHGTVFSIIFEKKFAVYARANNKIHEILKLFDLKNDDVANVDRIIDYNKVKRIKKKLKVKSVNYLVNSILNAESGKVEECI